MATLAGFKGGFAGEHRRAPTEQEIWDAAYQGGLAAARGAEKEPAVERFSECCGAELETPLEQLKFFCSGAMNGQDWLDSEPFFDAVEAQLSQSTPVPAQDARLAELEARHATDDDLWHIAGVVTELSSGSLFNVSQHECVTAIRASFMDPDSGRALLAAALKQPPSKVAAIDRAQNEHQLVGHVPRFVLRNAMRREAFYVSTAIHRDHNAPHDTVPVYVDGDFA